MKIIEPKQPAKRIFQKLDYLRDGKKIRHYFKFSIVPSNTITHFGKKILIGFVVLTYLVGTFQHAVLEVAHTLSHAFVGGHTYHSHQHEGEEIPHEHRVLDFSKTVLKENDRHSGSTQNTYSFSFEKMPQILSSTTITGIIAVVQSTSIVAQNWQIPVAPVFKIPFPPPRFV